MWMLSQQPWMRWGLRGTLTQHWRTHQRWEVIAQRVGRVLHLYTGRVQLVTVSSGRKLIYRAGLIRGCIVLPGVMQANMPAVPIKVLAMQAVTQGIKRISWDCELPVVQLMLKPAKSRRARKAQSRMVAGSAAIARKRGPCHLRLSILMLPAHPRP